MFVKPKEVEVDFISCLAEATVLHYARASFLNLYVASIEEALRDPEPFSVLVALCFTGSAQTGS